MSSVRSYEPPRIMKAILVFIGLVAVCSSAVAQVSGAFIGTGQMNSPRHFHAATLLEDGRVLITGGCNGNARLASAERRSMLLKNRRTVQEGRGYIV